MTMKTQDQFLQNLIDTKARVNVYLISGIKLLGTIKSFDTFSIRLDNDSSSQLVYKHAISTVLSTI